VVFLLSACTGSGFKAEEEKLSATYPSQFLFGDVYVLNNHEKIDGNLAGIGTTLIIEDGATVMGDIGLIGSQIEIFGHVAGDINAFAGTTYIHNTAIITGSINQIAHQIDIEPGAHISGEINTFAFPSQLSIKDTGRLENIIDWLHPTNWIAFQLIRNLILVFITVLIIFLFKMPTLHVALCIKKNIAVSWGIGLLVILATPIVSLFLIITICLSPIGIILILTFLIADIWGWTGISFIIGDNLTRWLKIDWSEEAKVAVGTVLLGLASTLLAFLPCVGFMISSMVSAVGLGGIVLSKLGTIKKV
jgi:cytoskeletal protein CcmA (bactofilin family)